VLEVFAIREAAVAATQADLDNLAAAVKAMSKALVDENDFVLIKLDIEFHDALYRSAHHERCGTRGARSDHKCCFVLTKRHASTSTTGTLSSPSTTSCCRSSRSKCRSLRKGNPDPSSATYDRLISSSMALMHPWRRPTGRRRLTCISTSAFARPEDVIQFATVRACAAV